MGDDKIFNKIVVVEDTMWLNFHSYFSEIFETKQGVRNETRRFLSVHVCVRDLHKATKREQRYGEVYDKIYFIFSTNVFQFLVFSNIYSKNWKCLKWLYFLITKLKNSCWWITSWIILCIYIKKIFTVHINYHIYLYFEFKLLYWWLYTDDCQAMMHWICC